MSEFDQPTPYEVDASIHEQEHEQQTEYVVPPQYERNLGFFSEDEQRRLGESVVAIAGAGGDGGMLAVQLARMGVGAHGGEIRLADPDPFEAQNINRQATCTTDTIDVNKAVAVGGYINKINPAIKVELFTDGVTQGNVAEFVKGADLLIDESEFTIQSIGIALARAARSEGIPNMHVMNVGFGAQVTSYAPDSKHTLERRLGVGGVGRHNEIDPDAEVGVDKWLANIPAYADLDVFKKVVEGKSAPSVAPGVAIAAGIGAVQASLHLLGEGNNRPKPVTFPETRVIDAYDGTSTVVRHAKLGFLTSMAKTYINNLRGRVPKAAY